jgi:hypothetical protein
MEGVHNIEYYSRFTEYLYFTLNIFLLYVIQTILRVLVKTYKQSNHDWPSRPSKILESGCFTAVFEIFASSGGQ